MIQTVLQRDLGVDSVSVIMSEMISGQPIRQIKRITYIESEDSLVAMVGLSYNRRETKAMALCFFQACMAAC